MTRFDFENIIEIIEAEKNKEKKLCEHYIKLNPDDCKRRQIISDYVISGMNMIENELIQKYKNRLA